MPTKISHPLLIRALPRIAKLCQATTECLPRVSFPPLAQIIHLTAFEATLDPFSTKYWGRSAGEYTDMIISPSHLAVSGNKQHGQHRRHLD